MPLDYMNDIPVEIWDRCWSFSPVKDLGRLCQTCRPFLDICRPLSLKSIEFSVNTNLIPDSQAGCKEFADYCARYIDLLHWLAVHPQHAKCVKSCAFIGDFGTRSNGVIDLGRPLTGLDVLRNAFWPSVHLDRLDIDDAILAALSKLPLLRDIAILNGAFTSFTVTPLLNLRSISLVYVWMPEHPSLTDFQIRIFASRSLQNLMVIPDSAGIPLIKHLILQGGCQILTHFWHALSPSSVTAIFDFLKVCPNLLYLTLVREESLIVEESRPELAEILYPPFPLSALPRIKHFTGPPELASVIVPGRPVRTLALLGSWQRHNYFVDKGQTILASIGQSTGPVISLHFPADALPTRPDIFSTITNEIPTLHHLCLFLNDPPVCIDHVLQQDAVEQPHTLKHQYRYLFQSLLNSLCDGTVPLPANIAKLAIMERIPRASDEVEVPFVSKVITVPEEEQAISDLSAIYPSLQSFTCGSRLFRWTKNTNGDWERSHNTEFIFRFSEDYDEFKY